MDLVGAYPCGRPRSGGKVSPAHQTGDGKRRPYGMIVSPDSLMLASEQ